MVKVFGQDTRENCKHWQTHENFGRIRKDIDLFFHNHRIWMIPIDSGRQNRRGIRFLRSWVQKQKKGQLKKIPQKIRGGIRLHPN